MVPSLRRASGFLHRTSSRTLHSARSCSPGRWSRERAGRSGCLFSGLHARGRVLTAAAVPLTMGVTEEVEVASCLKSRGLLGGGVLDDAVLGQHNATVFVGAGGHRAAFCYLGVLVAVDYDEADDTTMMRTTASTPNWSQRRLCLAGALLGLLGRNLAGFFAGVGRHACSFGWEYGRRFVHFF